VAPYRVRKSRREDSKSTTLNVIVFFFKKRVELWIFTGFIKLYRDIWLYFKAWARVLESMGRLGQI